MTSPDTNMGMSERPDDVAQGLRPYLPRLLISWLNEQPGTIVRALEGSVVFVDISGFTKMSERLARHGKVGAEEVTDVLGSVFSRLLVVAYENGGSLVKFGGDALLLFFAEDGHAMRAARAALGMRTELRAIGRIGTSAGLVTLRMSVGVHSGLFQFFLVGRSHRELVIAGPAASETVLMENTASAGEILVSPATASMLPLDAVGTQKGEGRLLRRVPTDVVPVPAEPVHRGEGDVLSGFIPLGVREHLLAGPAEPEHRVVTIAFIHFEGVDEMIAQAGGDLCAFALDGLVTSVQDAADRHGVTFLGTDVDRDGGKIILVAGAPDARGDDEERMLLTVRAIADADPPVAVRIGVNRGPVFVGDVGPPYRRTYTVMGDAVNLAARVMSRAEPGGILVTQPVVDASGVRFRTEALEPFLVKGKKQPVLALRLGAIQGSRRTDDIADLPLVGRAAELDTLRQLVETASAGRGALLEVTGRAGIGKSRLIQEIRGIDPEVQWHAAACEPFETSTPYFAFRSLLRGLFALPPDAPHDDTVAALEARVRARCPDLLPWLPLLAVALDLEVPETPEVAALDERFRRERLEAAVGDLLERVVDRPTVAVIDDARWLDGSSLDLVRALASRVDHMPLLLVVARRDPDEDEGYGADARRVAIALGPLSPDAAVALIHAATEHAPLTQHAVDLLVRRSGGEPRFLKAMLHAVLEAGGSVDGLPGSIEGLVMAQLDRLAPRDRARVRYLSVLGMSFTADAAARLLGDEGLEADPSQWQALAGLLTPDGPDGFRFRNGLVRDVAYESLPFRRRRELHARVAETIAATAGAAPDELAEILSFHFLHAQRYPEAWRFSRVAGRHAGAIYANVDGAEFYRRALEAAKRLPDEDPVEVSAVFESLGDLQIRLGEYDAAAASYRSARRLVDDDVARARLLFKEAQAPDWQGRYVQALRTLSRAIRLLDGRLDVEASKQRAQLMVQYGGIRYVQGRFRDAIEWCRRAIAVADASGERDALAHAYYVLDLAYVAIGRVSEAVHSPRALAIYEDLGDLGKQAIVLGNMAALAFWRGDWNGSLELWARGREACLKTGAEVEAAYGTVGIGEILAYQGRLDEAEVALREGSRILRASSVRTIVAFVNGLLGVVEARRGRFEEAHDYLNAAREEYREIGESDHVSEIDGLEAECLVLEGRTTEAAASARRLLGDGPGGPQVPMLHRVLGLAALASADREAARAAFRASLDAAREREADHEVALTLDVVLEGLPDEPDGIALRRERDELFERLGITGGGRIRTPVG